MYEFSEKQKRQRAVKAAKIKANMQKFVEYDPKNCDPLGSYTGQPEQKYDVPVQDADDL